MPPKIVSCGVCGRQYQDERRLEVHFDLRHGAPSDADADDANDGAAAAAEAKKAAAASSQNTLVLKSTKPKAEADFEIPFDSLEIGRELGAGSFGRVVLATFEGAPVAVKMIKSAVNNSTALPEDEADAFRAEAQVMRQLPPHPNVIRLVGVVTKSEPMCIVTEFARHGALDKYLKDAFAELSQAARICMCLDAARGVAHLHRNRLVHRDIAARNFLINSVGKIMVADFGMSRKLQHDQAGNVTKTTVGPLRYMAPESLANSEYSMASDVWAFGVLLWEIESGGKTPYGDLTLAQTAMQVVMEDLRLQEPPNCIDGLYDIMFSCWNMHADKRPTMDSLLDSIRTIRKRFQDEEYYRIPDDF